MSVRNCLAKLAENGQISREVAAQAYGLWERYQGRYSLDMPAASAEKAAALQAARVMGETVKAKRYSVAMQVSRQTVAEQEQMAHPWGPAAGGMAMLTRDIYRRGGSNVDTRMQTIREALTARFDAGIEAYKSTALGLKQDLAGVQNMVRELFGEETGDQTAKAAARGWQDAVKFGTEYVQKAGKIFEPNENWRLPQAWNPDRVRRFGNGEEFKAEMRQWIGKGGVQIFDKIRMEVATDPARIEELLNKAARDIITEAGSGPVFSKEMRTFLFQPGKDGADAWLALQGKYGTGQDILSTLTGHLNGMAREAALVDVLGPQYAATAKLLEENAAKWEKADATTRDKLRPQAWVGLESSKAIKRTFDVLSGRANGVESQFWSGALGATRSLTVSAKLGSAIVPAIVGDSVTALLAARWNGMSFGGVMARTVEDIFAGNPEMKEQAARLLVTGHAVSDHAIGTLRYSDNVAGPDTMKRVASFVVRASGLEAWTGALKKSFTMEFLGYTASQTSKSFDALDQPFRDFLQRYQVTPAEWDRVRALPLQQVHGATFFDSSHALTDDAVRKVYEGIVSERAYAVLEPDARVRNVTTAGAPTGSFAGEMARNLFLFKSFSLTMVATHMMKLATEDASIGSKLLNGLWFLGLHVAAGALAIQARQALTGKDPIDMNQPKFWWQSAMQGGGLGYYGDLVNVAAQGTNRSFASELAGPVVGLADDSIQLLRGATSKTYEGMPGGAVGKALTMLHQNTPGANLWYSRLAVDRLLFDRLQRAVDPYYAQSFARREQSAMKSFGQQYWWRPGENAPDRGPDMGTAFGR